MEFRLEDNDLLNSDSRVLQKYRGNITTQKGEDGIFAEIFKRIDDGFVRHKIVCDVGASDGILYSNSWALINHENWHGVLVESDKTKFQALDKYYKSVDCVACVNALVGNVTTLDSILDAYSAPEDFDFLSIDVDGTDWHIWNSLVNYKPRVVCIEFNPSMQHNVFYVQENDDSIRKGSSLRAIIELGKNKGYELVATTDFNAMFVRDEYFPLFEIEDNSIYAMHSTNGYAAVLFQFYDGTACKGGMLDKLWSNI